MAVFAVNHTSRMLSQFQWAWKLVFPRKSKSWISLNCTGYWKSGRQHINDTSAWIKSLASNCSCLSTWTLKSCSVECSGSVLLYVMTGPRGRFHSCCWTVTAKATVWHSTGMLSQQLVYFHLSVNWELWNVPHHPAVWQSRVSRIALHESAFHWHMSNWMHQLRAHLKEHICLPTPSAAWNVFVPARSLAHFSISSDRSLDWCWTVNLDSDRRLD